MNFSVTSGAIEIRVDRKTELLGIIEIISTYRNDYPQLLEKNGNKKYVEEIEQRFSKYKNHRVIQLFNEIVADNNFCYDAPVSLFLQLKDDFSFDELDDYPFKSRLNSDNRVIELLKGLGAFAQEIDFDAFYNGNKERYEKFINNIKKQIDEKHLIDFMTSYYGITSIKNFIVNLIPFQTWGNYGTDHQHDIVANISGLAGTTEEEELYPSDTRIANIVYLLHHEFSHGFINSLTEDYHIIASDDPIFKDIMEKMKEQAYDDNDSIINEHIIRALTLRYRFLVENDIAKYNQAIQREKDCGFIYIDNILDSLMFYENNRDKYKSISEYYPHIIENIINESKKNNPKR